MTNLSDVFCLIVARKANQERTVPPTGRIGAKRSLLDMDPTDAVPQPLPPMSLIPKPRPSSTPAEEQPTPPTAGDRSHVPDSGEAAPTPKPLTPEEQMALFEDELRESDWGHQPC